MFSRVLWLQVMCRENNLLLNIAGNWFTYVDLPIAYNWFSRRKHRLKFFPDLCRINRLSVICVFKPNATVSWSSLIIFELIWTVLYISREVDFFFQIGFCVNISHEFPVFVLSLFLNRSSLMRVLVDENSFLDCEDIILLGLYFTNTAAFEITCDVWIRQGFSQWYFLTCLKAYATMDNFKSARELEAKKKVYTWLNLSLFP